MPSDFDDLFAEIGAPNLGDSLGEAVVQWPLGVAANAITLAGVIVDISDLGDAPADDEAGTQIVYWGRLLVPVSVMITDTARPQQRDIFVVRGLIWHCEKIVSQGLSLQTVRIKRTEGASSKRTRVR